MAKKKIDRKRWYSLLQVHEEQLIPRVRTRYTLRKLVNDEQNLRILQPRVVGDRKGKRYFFLGANIIKFIDQL